MSRARRLSAADAAWLGLDRPEHLMVVTAVLRLDATIELEPLRELVRSRLLPAYPTLRMRAVRSRLPLVRPIWRPDTGFDLARHVGTVQLDSEPALMQYVGRADVAPGGPGPRAVDPDPGPARPTTAPWSPASTTASPTASRWPRCC